jgi:hypothetical protein
VTLNGLILPFYRSTQSLDQRKPRWIASKPAVRAIIILINLTNIIILIIRITLNPNKFTLNDLIFTFAVALEIRASASRHGPQGSVLCEHFPPEQAERRHSGESLHCRYTAVTLLSHCCYTVVTLLLHCCHTVVTLLLHCCYTVVTLSLHCSYTAVRALSP